MEQRPASLRWSRYSPPMRCAATEPRSRPSSDVCEAERHGSSCGEEHADMVCGECPRWCCATKGLVSRGTAKGMACGAEPFTCCSRVLHILHFIGFNLFSVLVIYQWIDGTHAGGMRILLSCSFLARGISLCHPHIAWKLSARCVRWTARARAYPTRCARDFREITLQRSASDSIHSCQKAHSG